MKKKKKINKTDIQNGMQALLYVLYICVGYSSFLFLNNGYKLLIDRGGGVKNFVLSELQSSNCTCKFYFWSSLNILASLNGVRLCSPTFPVSIFQRNVQ